MCKGNIEVNDTSFTVNSSVSVAAVELDISDGSVKLLSFGTEEPDCTVVLGEALGHAHLFVSIHFGFAQVHALSAAELVGLENNGVSHEHVVVLHVHVLLSWRQDGSGPDWLVWVDPQVVQRLSHFYFNQL